jgi:hypothetical protein
LVFLIICSCLDRGGDPVISGFGFRVWCDAALDGDFCVLGFFCGYSMLLLYRVHNL